MQKQNLSTPTSPINPNKCSLDNGLGSDNNARPAKRVKVESSPIIGAVPLRGFHPSSVVFSQSMAGKVPNMVASPSLAPKLPASLEPKVLSQHGIQKIPTTNKVALPALPPRNKTMAPRTKNHIHKQFWKAGDYDGAPNGGDWELHASGSDHIRVHPRFLHSNATSHKWVLGAFAELLDNSMDEVLNGATFVKIDTIENKKNGGKMLVIEDNGGGMDPIKMRQGMSLGYSVKRKVANTIGQYGNGFKTSTMRLGADVIVFSRFSGEDGERFTQSVGLLSYTFLRSTKKEDIEVPMLDYERKGEVWKKIASSTSLVADWDKKLDTVVQWSPFSSEADLLEQFNNIKDHGTRIFIYNLWEDDQGELELDFDTDPRDIQIRGANKDEKNTQMVQKYPNSRHFLTYQYSLRSYISMLYLRVPPNFRMILRGEDVEHHNVVNDMMMTQQVTYRPQHSPDGAAPRGSNMVANVTVGFVKDAKSHIDVQGFNVYHKNRLIKPFWRVWHPAGSDGRGVIAVLEANFVEPAHDKQGFERTLVLSRLETKLAQMQKSYWLQNCHKIGYAPKQMKKSNHDMDQPSQATNTENSTELNFARTTAENKVSFESQVMHKNQNGYMEKQNVESKTSGSGDVGLSNNGDNHLNAYSLKSLSTKKVSRENRSQNACLSPYKMPRSAVDVEESNVDNNSGSVHSRKSSLPTIPTKRLPDESSSKTVGSSPIRMSRSDDDKQFNTNSNHRNMHSQKSLPNNKSLEKCSLQKVHPPRHGSPILAEDNGGEPIKITANVDSKSDGMGHEVSPSIEELTKENHALRERLRMKERDFLGDLLKHVDEERNKCKLLEADLYQERNRCNVLEAQLLEAKRTIKQQQKEQDDLIDIFLDERKHREAEEQNLREKLNDALNKIEELQNIVCKSSLIRR